MPENIFDIACYYLMVIVCVLAVVMFISQLFLTQSVLGKFLLGLILILSIAGYFIARKEVKKDE